MNWNKVGQSYVMDNEIVWMFSIFDENGEEKVFQSQKFKMSWIN